MSKGFAIVLSATLIALALPFFPLHTTPKVVDSDVLSEKTVTVSATIGKLQAYSLFGYTSAYATVRLDGIALYKETKARQDGYFEFVNFLAPANLSEFCLSAVDTEGLATPHLCVPVPTQRVGSMGPYLLAPSIQLSSGSSSVNESVLISGKTIPNTNVSLELFTEEASPLTFIKPSFAKATEGEARKIQAANDGGYSYAYSSPSQATYRVFSRSFYENASTPKSNTLTIDIIGWLMWLLLLLSNWLGKLLNPNLLIILEALLVAYLIYRRFFFLPRRSPDRGGSLLAVERELLVLPERPLRLSEASPLLTFRDFTPIAIT